MTTVVTFLGTGGGRFTTIRQARQTAGLYIEDPGLRANVDPGPGSLVHMQRYGIDPTRTEAMCISHAHPDHWTDATVLLEGMSRGGIDRKGHLIAPRSVLQGTIDVHGETLGPVIGPRHQAQTQKTQQVAAGDRVQFARGPSVTVTKQDHSDPDTVGFRFHLEKGDVSYIPDTQYFPELHMPHVGTDVLICQMTRGGNEPIDWHMCTSDVEKLAMEIQPKLLLLTHFGFRQLKEGDPSHWAGKISRSTGIQTFAARDGLQLRMGKTMDLQLVDAELAVYPKA